MTQRQCLCIAFTVNSCGNSVSIIIIWSLPSTKNDWILMGTQIHKSVSQNHIFSRNGCQSCYQMWIAKIHSGWLNIISQGRKIWCDHPKIFGWQVVKLLSHTVSTYLNVITLATVVIHRFLLSCPVQVLPSQRRGNESDSSEADGTPFAGPILLRPDG